MSSQFLLDYPFLRNIFLTVCNQIIPTFAKMVSVRETFLSAWLFLKPKSLGPRIAGA